MNFIVHELGWLSGGVAEVVLRGNAANVKLMDATNYESYRAGRTHQYYGGHYRQSPVQIPIPRAGHWYITVDLGGYRGEVHSSARVLQPAR